MGSVRGIFKFIGFCPTLIVIALASTSCTTDTAFGRALTWGLSDSGDIDRFPAEVIEGGTNKNPFEIESDSGPILAVETAFKKIPVALSGRRENQSFTSYLDSSNTKGFLVLRRGKIVFEWYEQGANPQTLFTCFSVSKSIVSILVGLALDRGLVDLNDPITKYIPELGAKDPRFRHIAVSNLLEMNSGIAYHEGLFAFDDIMTYYEPDLFETCLKSVRVETEPGLLFVYNNYNPILLGIIIERSSGMSLTQFASRYYWSTLGAQNNASWSLSKPSGNPKMESGFNACLRDFALIGYRFLHDEGPYAERSRTPRQNPPPNYYRGAWFEGKLLYAYFWYRYPDIESEQFLAAGHLGQYIYLNKKSDLVMVRIGDDDGPPGRDWMLWFESFSKNFM